MMFPLPIRWKRSPLAADGLIGCDGVRGGSGPLLQDALDILAHLNKCHIGILNGLLKIVIGIRVTWQSWVVAEAGKSI
jgi:hypothetical protein